MVVGLEKVVFKEECLSDVRRTDESMKMFEIRNMATEAGISGHTIAKTKNDLIQFILNSKESKKSAESLYTFFWREIEK